MYYRFKFCTALFLDSHYFNLKKCVYSVEKYLTIIVTFPEKWFLIGSAVNEILTVAGDYRHYSILYLR